MIKKGRNSVLQRYDNTGERHPLAKLNDEDVKRFKQLISAGMSIPEIALLFPQVHKTTLYDIKAGKTWRHIS
jgi:hypothetical protein